MSNAHEGLLDQFKRYVHRPEAAHIARAIRRSGRSQGSNFVERHIWYLIAYATMARTGLLHKKVIASLISQYVRFSRHTSK